MNNEQNSAIEELKRAVEEGEASKRSNYLNYLDLSTKQLESDFIRPEDIKAKDNIRKQYKKILTRSRIQKLIKAGNILDPEGLDPEDRETSEALKAYHRELINAKYTIGFSRYRNKPDQDIINELKTDIHFLIAKFYKENENADDLAADEWEDYLKACMFEPLSFCENIHAEELINLINSELEIKENWKPKKKTGWSAPAWALSPTMDGYTHALKTVNSPEDKVFLAELKENIVLITDEEGALKDPDKKEFDLAPYKKDFGKPALNEAMLQNVYTVVKERFELLSYDEKMIVDPAANFKIPMKDFVKMIKRGPSGGRSGVSESDILSVVAEINRFKNFAGIIKYTDNYDRKKIGYYAVINTNYYNPETGMFSFSAPYLVFCLQEIEKKRTITHTDTKKKEKRIELKAVYSYELKPTYTNIKTAAAREIISYVCQLIPRRGLKGDTWNNPAHVSLRTLIAECPTLKYEYETASSARQSRTIQRALESAWKNLPKHTYLKEHYKDIQLPNPDDPNNIPTKKDLDHVFNFPHRGKIGEEDTDK